MINEIYQSCKNIEINEEWLYHWIIDENMLYSVYRNGILSKSNLRKNNIDFLRDNPSNVGCNGSEYISVCKRIENNSFAYQRYIRKNCAFIINPNIDKRSSITTEEEVKRSPIIQFFIGPKKELINRSIVNYPDEYLVRDRILFKDIIGLKLPNFYDENDILMLHTFLENINHDLPIIDIERKKEIDKTKIKSLFK